MDNLENLYQERADQTRALQDTNTRFQESAKAENRDLTSEDKAELDKRLADIEALDVQIESAEAAQRESDDRSRRFNEVVERSNRLQTRRVAPIGRNLGVDPLASDEYRDAFAGYLSTGQMRAEVMSLTAAAGGYMITQTKVAEEITALINGRVALRQLATLETVDSAITYRKSRVSAGISVGFVAEGSEISADTAMAFGAVDLTPQQLVGLKKVSIHQLATNARAEKTVVTNFGQGFAEAEEGKFYTGAGTTEPLGLFVANAGGVPTSRDVETAATTLAADDFITARYSLNTYYGNLPTTRWVMSRAITAAARKMKDSNGQYLWQPSLQAGTPDLLCGVPVIVSDFAPTAVTGGSYVAVIGDMSSYHIVEYPGGFGIQRLNERYAEFGLVGFLARRFVMGAPVDPNAFSRIKIKAS